MTKRKLWERLHLSQWGRVKAMADHLGFKVQRLKADRYRLLMPNVEVNDTLADIELTDTLTNVEACPMSLGYPVPPGMSDDGTFRTSHLHRRMSALWGQSGRP